MSSCKQMILWTWDCFILFTSSQAVNLSMHPFLGPSLLSNFTRTSRVNTSVIRQLTILLDTLVWHTPSSFPLLSKYPTSARPNQEVLSRLGSRTNPDKTRSIVHRSLNIKCAVSTTNLDGRQRHSFQAPRHIQMQILYILGSIRVRRNAWSSPPVSGYVSSFTQVTLACMACFWHGPGKLTSKMCMID